MEKLEDVKGMVGGEGGEENSFSFGGGEARVGRDVGRLKVERK